MSTNSLEIFKQLFLKHPKDIKDIFTNVSAFVEDQDRAIAVFLSVEYPELIWLIRTLQHAYEKQFSANLPHQQQEIEHIARSITLNVDETGTIDYGQHEHNNIVFNTLETHFVSSQPAVLNDSQEQDDIISLDGSTSEMEVVYQRNTTFTDIAQQIATPQLQRDAHTHVKNHLPPNSLMTPHVNTSKQHDASPNIDHNNNNSDATVTQNKEHVIIPNANDAIDLAKVVDQVVSSQGEVRNLMDSMHALKRPSIINLLTKDLRHKLNALRHKPTDELPGFLLIKASSIPGFNRLDKLNFISDNSHLLTGFLDTNWMYHDKQATVIVEFTNQQQAQQALHSLHSRYPDTDIINVTDMRTILNRPNHPTTHTSRYYDHQHNDHHSMETSDSQVDATEYPEFTYRLTHVPLHISHEDITYNMSYYGQIERIQDVDQLPPTQREILITFDRHARINLLNHIWAVNVKGYNISIAHTSITNSQLEQRKLFVAGFRGFHYRTTESQALRIFRPYEGMSCQIHQNIAYIAFKTDEQMQSVCRLRLYTDDNRLLTGRPRVNRAKNNVTPPGSPNPHLTIQAMSTQTSAPKDLNSPPPSKQRKLKYHRSVQPPTLSNHNLNDDTHFSSNQTNT